MATDEQRKPEKGINAFKLTSFTSTLTLTFGSIQLRFHAMIFYRSRVPMTALSLWILMQLVILVMTSSDVYGDVKDTKLNSKSFQIIDINL